jgi:hypothetical protein
MITDAGAREIHSLKNLHVLELSGAKVTDGAIQALQKALPKLTIYR